MLVNRNTQLLFFPMPSCSVRCDVVTLQERDLTIKLKEEDLHLNPAVAVNSNSVSCIHDVR